MWNDDLNDSNAEMDASGFVRKQRTGSSSPEDSAAIADKGESKARPRRNNGIRITIIVAAALLLLVSAVFISILCVMGKIGFISGDLLRIPENLDSIILDGDYTVSESDTLDESQMEALDSNIKDQMVDEEGLRCQDGVTNILVLGIDARQADLMRARTDVIIILSINENTGKIVMSSIMRDTYVAIPGRTGNDKINAANAYGGPSLTVETVESAFGIKIDRFVMVNFYAFMDVVDALGGVTVDINGGEKKHMNNYIREINRYMHVEVNDGLLYETGEDIHLTGKQAMGYVRVRYSGNGDYERTERQREVLEQLIVKARTADYVTLLSIVNDVAGNITTDLTMTEITMLALSAPNYINYDIEQLRIPAEGTYWGGIYKGTWLLDIDFESNREMLYAAVFGDDTDR